MHAHAEIVDAAVRPASASSNAFAVVLVDIVIGNVGAVAVERLAGGVAIEVLAVDRRHAGRRRARVEHLLQQRRRLALGGLGLLALADVGARDDEAAEIGRVDRNRMPFAVAEIGLVAALEFRAVLDAVVEPLLLAADRVDIHAAPRRFAQHVRPLHAGLDEVGDRCVHLAVEPVAHHQPMILVIERKPFRQGLDGVRQHLARQRHLAVALLVLRHVGDAGKHHAPALELDDAQIAGRPELAAVRRLEKRFAILDDAVAHQLPADFDDIARGRRNDPRAASGLPSPSSSQPNSRSAASLW